MSGDAHCAKKIPAHLFFYPFVMQKEEYPFSRTERLLGGPAVNRLAGTRVIVFGVGGVGSWCVEGLVRSGIGTITIVDPDCVAISNINRQLPATLGTVGRSKVEVMKERMLDLNPHARITALREAFTAETAARFRLDEYDYIIDAIDSLTDKAELILAACRTKAVLYSSMGAALKMDTEQVKVAEFWKVNGCPLAAALRRKFKKSGVFPSRKFRCIFSPELLKNEGDDVLSKGETYDNRKVVTNGSLVHITAVFGFMLSGLVMQHVWKSGSNGME